MATTIRQFFLAVALLAPAASASAQAPLPFPPEYERGWMAKVNGDPILKSEVLARMGKRIDGLRNAKGGRPEEFAREFLGLFNDTLVELVRERVVNQKARKYGIVISDQEVEDREEEIVKREAGGDREKFKEMLAQSDLTMTKWKEGLKSEMIMEIVLHEEMDRTAVFVPPAVALAWFVEHPEEFQHPERVRLLVLEIKSQRGAEGRARRLAESIRKQVDAGADFAGLTKYRDAEIQQEAPVDLQWRTKTDLEPALAGEAFKAVEGAFVGPVKGESGTWYLARVVGREDARKTSFEEAQHAIIFMLRNEMLRRARAAAALKLMSEGVIEFSVPRMQQEFDDQMEELKRR
ncbi:MAG: peptidylprolyl isomerase [Planctomycetota bacterium]